jgi:hypothetical protein
MRKFYLLVHLVILSSITAFSQPVDDLFFQRKNLASDYRVVARKYQALEVNSAKLSTLVQQAPASLKLTLPFEDQELTLQLQKVKITSADFTVIEVLPDGDRRTVNYPGAVFYHGKIEGKPSSFATISIVDGEVSGIIADEKSNIILGSIEDNGLPTKEYVIYRETDLNVSNPLNCFTGEIPVEGSNITGNETVHARPTAVGEPVEVYFECDYKFYQDKGSNTVNLINYVLSFFNNTALLYANENITIQVSQILVWTMQDPEAAAGLNTSGTCLTSFRDRMVTTPYVGDYAHFLSTRSLGGGIAYLLGTPCSSSKQFRSAVSAIHNSYNNFPTYSWTVQVVTHELGHNLGSNHTHWCGWTGGAIDNCGPSAGYPNEGGSCVLGPPPVGGGTIMSYCHLTSSINFNNGFGTFPGDRIRQVVNNATCFGNCRMTIAISKQDASCGQNNGSATVTATNNTGTLFYAWSNGQTGASLINAAPGTYHVTVADASGCQVMQVVTIGNSGSALTFSLTPSGTAGFCASSTLILSATNNPSYNYVWRKDGNIVVGATSSSLTVSAIGNYSVTVTSGSCTGTQSVMVSEVATPTASILAGGPATFCDGNAVQLSSNAGSMYSYQWYNNGNPIGGATAAVYNATATGSYTVKVYAGSCEASSSAFAVTVNPSPAAVISTSTSTSFCDGGNVGLFASTGAGYSYQWYRNGDLIFGAIGFSYNATLGGNYTVVTSTGTCSKTSPIRPVTVWTLPTVMVSPIASTIEKFSSQTLTATGAPAYNWASLPAMVSTTANSGTYRPLTTTTYAVQGTDANGCRGTANAIITVIGCGNVTEITATPYSPSRVYIRWKNPEGATTDSLRYRKTGTSIWTSVFVTGEEHELNGLEPGTDYEYSITPLCNTTTVFIPSPTRTFRTEELKGDLYIRLYPNPVSSISSLEIIAATGFSLQVSIFDNMGRIVNRLNETENFAAGQVIKKVNAGVLANGVYHLAILINGKMHHVKMVVLR